MLKYSSTGSGSWGVWGISWCGVFRRLDDSHNLGKNNALPNSTTWPFGDALNRSRTRLCMLVLAVSLGK
jgi:hypothetical protein